MSAKKMKVISTKNSEENTWAENCQSFVFLASKTLSIKKEIMPAGTKEKWHHHNKAQQFFYILKGQAVFHLEGESSSVNKEEGIHVEAGKKHFIENKSTEILEFLVISEPDTKGDRIETEDES